MKGAWTWMRTRAAPTVVGALAIGLLGGAALGFAPLKRRVGALKGAQPAIEVEWPPLVGHRSAAETDPPATWMPAGERMALEMMLAQSISGDPFDAASLKRGHEALMATGWFAEAPTIRREREGRVIVTGAWRTPAAVVRHEGTERLVSRDGRLLRLEYASGSSGALRVISGVTFGPPRLERAARPAYGEQWLGGDVQAALGLLELLRSSPAWPEVAGVDCGRFMDEGRLTVVTKDGAAIVWGSPPGTVAPGEQRDSVKLHRLTSLLGDEAWISAGRPRAELFTPYVLIDESAGRE